MVSHMSTRFYITHLTFSIIGDCGDPISIPGGSSKTTVAHKRATRDWKSESVTNLRTYLLTWVGARDTCVSKKRMKWHLHIYMALISGMFVLLTLFTRGLGNLTIVKLHKFHIHKDFKFYQFHWCWNIPMSLDIFVSYWKKICKNFFLSRLFPSFVRSIG